MIKHRYESIPGWFNFNGVYSKVLNEIERGHFVEIGTCFGKSSSYMAVMIANSKKEIRFDTIDTFEGSPSEIDGKQSFFKTRDVYKEAMENLKDLPVNIIKGDSIKMSKKYKNKSLDFVFIDGAHDFKSVSNDIKEWKKKVKNGGYIGGHDYDNKNVFKAVNGILKIDCPIGVNSWLYRL